MQKINEFIESAIGKTIWNPHKRVSSEFVFEVGEKTESDRGELHFVISNCHWWLQKIDSEKRVDIVNSESEQNFIEKKISILEQKSIKQVDFDEETANTTFEFSDSLLLKVSPYGNDKLRDQWSVFTKDKVLLVKSNGTSDIQDNV
ncbi:MAG: hypothetical protein A2383_03415 [Candidatus Pacebacteria bacterium RIFOXYB1_FULL_39_46]|nr:MAG: hypothetical protein A2182_01465 [Candidatus Pacebacteria bacterium RIFOXYA1_FULL_38_18]OGJ38466.1 MAG: hypothetical protein A2383_03415 [Candidatus Pacebacteria bacterium RIFOXYB1_FULL_39_46]OGJ40326.1 MAG: hypothetical protein A2411_03555 [Candidatus Pacebacteria bacterium RIFOXYC1_FULL_39_21]OGJ40899.1 MAG: hypothetical protein A2582_02295 [Candidatus Pacebacteria bacterium RIFOXYD1_FULL_39_27]